MVQLLYTECLGVCKHREEICSLMQLIRAQDILYLTKQADSVSFF